MARPRQFVVRFNWQMGAHLVQVSAQSEHQAREIIKTSYPGCSIDSTRLLGR
jgi:hypothetical protein